MPNLFELAEGLWELVLAASDVDDLDSDDEIAGWQQAAVELLEGEIEDKMDSCCAVVRQLEADALYARDESNRLAARARQMEARAQALKQYMVETIKSLPKVNKGSKAKPVMKFPTIRGKRFSTWVAKSQDTFDPELVNITQAEEPYVTFEPKIHLKEANDLVRSQGVIPAGFENARKEGSWSCTIK